jgi:hypothetical protein
MIDFEIANVVEVALRKQESFKKLMTHD